MLQVRWGWGWWGATTGRPRLIHVRRNRHVRSRRTGYDTGFCTGSLVFPAVRLRNSASDGGLANSSDAYFGMQTTRTATSTTSDPSIADFHRLLYTGYNSGGGQNATNPHSVAGVEDYAYVFSLDDVVLKTAGGTDFFYQSGSRLLESAYSSASYTDLLDAQINSFTAPFFGGFDGFDIKKPDPMYNTGMGSTDACQLSLTTLGSAR